MYFETKKDEKNFKDNISTSITRSCNEAINNCDIRGHSVQEPDLVAHIIKQLPSDLYKSLHAYCPKIKFNVTGVFCHQKPIADIGNKPNPEIGDLLLAYIEENTAGNKICNSILLQAKTVSMDKYFISPNEKHQLKLYREWPKFKYMRAGYLNGITRDIMPKTISSGAQYLMMKYPYDNEKYYGCSTPNDLLVFGNKLSDNILNLLKFSTGRTFAYNHPVEDDWTNMVWDLIEIAKSAKFNRKNSGIVGEDRLFLEMYGDLPEGHLEFNNDKLIDYHYFDDEISTVPMIIIEGKVDDNLIFSEDYLRWQ